MNSDSTLRSFSDSYESVHDQVGGHRAIDEEQFPVLEAVRGELPRVVRLLVEAHDGGHVVLPEVRMVVLGAV